jgi:hypothetical protein
MLDHRGRRGNDGSRETCSKAFCTDQVVWAMKVAREVVIHGRSQDVLEGRNPDGLDVTCERSQVWPDKLAGWSYYLT